MSEQTEGLNTLEVEGVMHDFEERRRARLDKAWGAYPRRNPIASDLHPCIRYMVCALLAWEVKPRPDFRGMQIIEEGNGQESSVIRQMEDEGWKVVESQVPLTIEGMVNGRKTRVLTGRIDGKIELAHRKLLPFEVKSTSEYRFDSITCEEDLHKDIWIEK